MAPKHRIGKDEDGNQMNVFHTLLPDWATTPSAALASPSLRQRLECVEMAARMGWVSEKEAKKMARSLFGLKEAKK